MSEIIDSFIVPLGFLLGDPPPVKRLREIRVYLDGLIEILNGLVVVAHILIDYPPGYVDCFVIWHLADDTAEALYSLVELICSMVHQPQMESTADEILTNF